MMTNDQVHELAHNWRTTGATVCFKVRCFAPVRQLRQLLNNWQLEWRNGPPPESTGKPPADKKKNEKKKAQRCPGLIGTKMATGSPAITPLGARHHGSRSHHAH
jgi:hypothetical protein